MHAELLRCRLLLLLEPKCSSVSHGDEEMAVRLDIGSTVVRDMRRYQGTTPVKLHLHPLVSLKDWVGDGYHSVCLPLTSKGFVMCSSPLRLHAQASWLVKLGLLVPTVTQNTAQFYPHSPTQ